MPPCVVEGFSVVYLQVLTTTRIPLYYRRNPSDSDDVITLFVTNVPKYFSENDVKLVFGVFGTVASSSLGEFKDGVQAFHWSVGGRRPNRFALVNFSSAPSILLDENADYPVVEYNGGTARLAGTAAAAGSGEHDGGDPFLTDYGFTSLLSMYNTAFLNNRLADEQHLVDACEVFVRKYDECLDREAETARVAADGWAKVIPRVRLRGAGYGGAKGGDPSRRHGEDAADVIRRFEEKFTEKDMYKHQLKEQKKENVRRLREHHERDKQAVLAMHRKGLLNPFAHNAK